MKIIKSNEFKPNKAWDSLNITNMNGISVKIHWTNEAYKWHINDGSEVFAVLTGTIKMYYKENNEEKYTILEAGDIFYANVGCEHYAKPMPEARILVVEKEGSI